MAADILTVSTSEIRTLGRCKRLYRYEYVDGRRPASQGHELVWGAALHRGLEALYLAVKHGDEDAMTLALHAALTPGVDSEGRPYQPPADPYARAALSAMLRAYVEYWWTDATTYAIEGVEVPFCLPVRTARGRLVKGRICEACGGLGVWSDQADCPRCSGTGRLRPHREGRIDLVVRERKFVAENITEPDPTGKLWLVEHKSTTWEPSDERYYTGIERDLQLALYFDAAREMGLDPAGVMYDVIRRPAYDEVKPPPAMKKDGTPRAPASVPCEAEGCVSGYRAVGIVNPVAEPCDKCKGTGRIVKEVGYSNPRYGESAAAYEERIYDLATAPETRDAWFGRRMLTISEEQVRESRAIVHGAVDEIRWREKTGHYPMAGDRYTCAPPKRVCAWIDVCGGRVSVEDLDRLFPLKIKKEGV
ncbi:MAG: hypothetical protein EKK62_04050 [Acidimicrobiia bacterium]|nr:MAG: hypothetical protein EKK62_04050 [Acidimicrobiia bacterium]